VRKSIISALKTVEFVSDRIKPGKFLLSLSSEYSYLPVSSLNSLRLNKVINSCSCSCSSTAGDAVHNGP
jgi:hypothetical protein